MSFYKTVNLILEESEEQPKFEVLSPKKYSRAYFERMDGGGPSFISKVVRDGMMEVYYQGKKLTPNSEEAKKIKEEWEPVNLYTGKEIHDQPGINYKELRKYNIEPTHLMYYIVRDDVDADWHSLDHLAGGRVLSHMVWWLEPQYSKYTSKDTADEFGDLMGEL